MKIIFYGILVHFIFLLSIFDVYFNSPVLQGIKAYYPKFEPAANRLVLIVADGLRASTFYDNHLNSSPYLGEIVETKGSWGVSHTRVPTESRPGHVALIAGLYEDPSAVTKGWKENPVQFDSVFNRSSHTWAWGSPDIIPMFAKGEAAGRVTTNCYPASMQKFSGDGSNEKLDLWVLERVLNFFSKTPKPEGVHNKGNIFFLHLLGIDTTGHATKPHSRQYIDNIYLVDSGIKRVEEAINKFYNNDGKTAFIFTSDHGMTDWGSHGAGLPDETETPLVVWGAGLSGPLPIEPSDVQDEFTLKWGLAHLKRRDVQQADIAALMAALLATPTPTNNVGFVPHNLLSGNRSWVAQTLISNAHQILLQLERAKDLVHERLMPIFLQPFPQLPFLKLVEAENMINDGHIEEAIKHIEKIVHVALEGIHYYQEYFGRGLKWVVTASHIFWLFYLMKSLLVKHAPKRNSVVLQAIFVLVACITCFLIIVQHLPLQYVVYYSLPIFLLWSLCEDVGNWFPSVTSTLKHNTLHILGLVLVVVTGVALLVSSFYYRASLSLGLLFLALWPLGEMKFGKTIDTFLILTWAVSCLMLSVFPLMPVIGREANYTLVLLSGLLISALGLIGLWKLHLRKSHLVSRLDKTLLSLQILTTGIASFNVYLTAINFNAGLGLLWYHQGLSWLILAICCIIPGFTGTAIWVRVPSVWLSLASVLLLLSVNHEVLFLLALIVAMSIYPAIELQLIASNGLQENVETCLKKQTFITFGDVRRAYCYLFFTVLAFFGLGNIASLNSFDPSWVRCFVTTFAPHLMGLLILMKTIVPFLAVACGIFITSQITKRPIQWVLVLGVCDAMALPFFHLVVTQGSWLDVGQSISHFVIAHVCILMLLLLHWAAKHWLTFRWSIHPTQIQVPSLETAPKLLRKSHGE